MLPALVPPSRALAGGLVTEFFFVPCFSFFSLFILFWGACTFPAMSCLFLVTAGLSLVYPCFSYLFVFSFPAYARVKPYLLLLCVFPFLILASFLFLLVSCLYAFILDYPYSLLDVTCLFQLSSGRGRFILAILTEL